MRSSLLCRIFFFASIMSGVASTLAKKRALAAGFGTNANATRYLNQDFSTLRAQCRSAGKLFCDPTFPAAPEALGFNELGRSSYKVRGVTWKRPTVRTRAWSWIWMRIWMGALVWRSGWGWRGGVVLVEGGLLAEDLRAAPPTWKKPPQTDTDHI